MTKTVLHAIAMTGTLHQQKCSKVITSAVSRSDGASQQFGSAINHNDTIESTWALTIAHLSPLKDILKSNQEGMKSTFAVGILLTYTVLKLLDVIFLACFVKHLFRIKNEPIKLKKKLIPMVRSSPHETVNKDFR